MSQDDQTYQGLSEKEAKALLLRYGYNELPSQKTQSILKLLFSIISEPMVLLLLACSTIYIFLGEAKDAVMLMVMVFVVIGITYYQEHKTEKALTALKDLSSPRALVIRDGNEKHIAGREVTIGDLVIVREGDRIPADGVVLMQTNLTIDESLLTGESVPVIKKVFNDTDTLTRVGGDHEPFVYSGCLVVKGHGIIKITSIGTNTQMGKIGKSLENIDNTKTKLESEINKLVFYSASGGIFVCIVIVGIYGFLQGKWLQGILSGLTLSMSVLPEEFPVVMTIFLALGALRMSRKKVLARNTKTIETLGSATVLCTDKTGTLTQNQLRLQSITEKQETVELSVNTKTLAPNFRHILKQAVLASQENIFDPIEKAIQQAAKRVLTEKIYAGLKLSEEIQLDNGLFGIIHIWKDKHSKTFQIVAKGAPESIAKLCNFSKKHTQKLIAQVDQIAEKGLRILAVAECAYKENHLPSKYTDFAFDYCGLLGFSDPLRSTAKDAITSCYKAGVRVVMVTGDYPGTAQNIADQIGLKNPQIFLTGAQLQKMSKQELKKAAQTTNIFCRITPDQKLKIVEAFKANHEVVAMTGDGVNDAPALKAAHIGIAMGQRGTDVARETADLVVLNDDFSSIVQAIRMGRRIYDNLKKAISYVLAIHIPIAGLSVIPVLTGMPILLLPAHIAFLELVIDPACTTVFEAEKEEEDIMNRPPRLSTEPLIDSRTIIASILLGFSVLLSCLLMYYYAYYLKHFSPNVVRSVTFITLIIANLVLIINNRSWQKNIINIIKIPNKALLMVLGGSLLLLGLILSIPLARDLFHFAEIDVANMLIALAFGLISIIWFEVIKLLKKYK